MKRRIVQVALIATAILLPVNSSFAIDKSSAATEESDATPQRLKERDSRAQANQAKAKQRAKEKAAADKAKAAARAKLVDINSASKDELKKLPGIGDAEAERIVAGRPYLTKAHLLTHKVLPDGVYEPIKRLIVAKQMESTATAPAKSKH